MLVKFFALTAATAAAGVVAVQSGGPVLDGNTLELFSKLAGSPGVLGLIGYGGHRILRQLDRLENRIGRNDGRIDEHSIWLKKLDERVDDLERLL